MRLALILTGGRSGLLKLGAGHEIFWLVAQWPGPPPTELARRGIIDRDRGHRRGELGHPLTGY